MKKIKIALYLGSVSLFGLTACLKENPMNIDPSKGTPNIVEFANTGDNISKSTSKYPGFYTDFGVKNVGESGTFNINVGYSGVDVAPQDITVNIALDTAALSQYNKDNGTNLIVPSSDVYSFPSSLVIKKGTQLAQGTAKINVNSNYDFSAAYALPLKITSATTGVISGNFGSAIYTFGVRNKYDGLYMMDGSMSDAFNPGLTGYYPLKEQLRTVSANSVVLWDPNVAKTYGHPIKNGTSSSYYGSFSPVFYFDASGNVTKVENFYGQPSGNGRSAQLDPTGINKITFNSDGSINKIDVSYIMIQGGTPRTTFQETFTYLGSR